MSESNLNIDVPLHGIAASPGVASGPLVVIDRENIPVPKRTIKEEHISRELSRLETALVETRAQIQQIKEHLSSSIGEKDASIFDAHLLVLEDSSLLEAVKRQMSERLMCAEYIFHHIIQAYSQSMREVDDPYLQERAADLMDVGKRVLNNLMGNHTMDRYELEQPSIILAHDLSPGDTAMLDRSKVLGFATDLGGKVSHAAIIARALNIPAVVGLKDASFSLESGTHVLLDGYEGSLILNPSEATLYEYGQMEEKRHAVDESLEELRETHATTQDGRRLVISANVELPEDLPLIKAAGAEGIGLYRTEFLYLNRLDLPDEDEQVEVYRRVVEGSHPHPVIFRTLDIGGDKILSNLHLDEELNPFLGWRAVRFTLERREIFETQLRAICRAGAGHRIRIMFPMITIYEELVESKKILQGVLRDLKRSGKAHATDIEIGAMIEVPSAVMIVEHIATEVDFLSIGTNDLVQYTLAVDRTNERVAYLYQPAHPSILAFIKRTVEAAHKSNIWVGVCGETAGDVMLTPLLVGLGVDELSMGSIFIPRVKKAVQSLNYEEMRQLTEEVMRMPTADAIMEKVEAVVARSYPELVD